MISLGRLRPAGLTAAVPFAVVALSAAPASAALTISTAATQNVTCENGLCAATANNAVLNVVDLESLLASGDVEVTTTGQTAQANDIRVEAPLSWSTTSGLTLDAYQSVLIGEPVSISGVAGLAVTTNDGGSNGVLLFEPKGNVTFDSTSSTLAINGASYMLVNTLPELASAIANNPNGDYALGASYDASEDGIYTAAPISTDFSGTFNGLGNAISHLTIRAAEKNANIGLFATLETAGSINSVGVTEANVKVNTASYAGPVAGISYGSIFNTFGSGKISGASGLGGAVGGLVGYSVMISNAAANTVVNVGSHKVATEIDAGGLVGANGGVVQQSYATGNVTVTGLARSPGGGLVGWNNGLIQDCYAQGAVSVPSNSLVGGLAGETLSTVAYSYSTGAPSSQDGNDVGGLIGYDDHEVENGNITDNYWDTTTSGIGNNQGAGNIQNDPGIKGETSAQLESGLPKGFNRKIWAEDRRYNGGQPYLIANPPRWK